MAEARKFLTGVEIELPRGFLKSQQIPSLYSILTVVGPRTGLLSLEPLPNSKIYLLKLWRERRC